jgi:hypothetical protein
LTGAAEGGAEAGAEEGAEEGEERRWTSVEGRETEEETKVSETEAEVGAEAGRERDTAEEVGVIVLFFSSGDFLTRPERILFSSVFKGCAVEEEEEEVAVSGNAREIVSANDRSSSARCKVSRLSVVKVAGVVVADPISDSARGSECSSMDEDDDDEEDEVLKSISELDSVGKKLDKIIPGPVDSVSKLSAVSDSSLLLSPSVGTLVAIRAVEQIYGKRKSKSNEDVENNVPTEPPQRR